MTGSVHVDLSCVIGADGDEDRRRLAVLERCPDGARVVVNIGVRTFVTPDLAAAIHAHANRLAVEITGADPAAVTLFVRASRAGAWEGI